MPEEKKKAVIKHVMSLKVTLSWTGLEGSLNGTAAILFLFLLALCQDVCLLFFQFWL